MPLPADYRTNRGITVGSGRRLSPSAVLHDSFVDPPASDTNGISASHAGASAASTRFMPIDGDLVTRGVAVLSPGRNVVITVTHGSAVVAMSGTITGTRGGKVVTEAWSVTAGGTSKVFTGAKVFDSVTSITEVVAANASANTIIAGSGAGLGLSATASVASALKEVVAGSLVTNGVILGALYTPNTAPDGANDYDVWYISDLPEAGA